MDPNNKPKAEHPNSQQQQEPGPLENKPIPKPRHHGPANHNQHVSDPLAHFLTIPWAAALLTDPAVLGIEVTDRRPRPDGYARLMRSVVNGSGTVRACVSFVTMRSEGSSVASRGESGGGDGGGGGGGGGRTKTREDPKRPFLQFHVLLDVGEDLCGYPGVMHGGAIMLMLDEAMGSAANRSQHVVAVTAAMKVRFSKVIKLPAVVLVRARVVKKQGRRITVRGSVENSKGEIHAEAESVHVIQTLQRKAKL
ncbi:hypothetical protein VTJ83DRAFT_4929 [Remersonia thermophila]|uniref:Thioesterase domain-containing protein n=1 Tax=Remersonia thermophila TaxID=72144 RepID=A0ABR4DBC4_9PEZI